MSMMKVDRVSSTENVFNLFKGSLFFGKSLNAMGQYLLFLILIPSFTDGKQWMFKINGRIVELAKTDGPIPH